MIVQNQAGSVINFQGTEYYIPTRVFKLKKKRTFRGLAEYSAEFIGPQIVAVTVFHLEKHDRIDLKSLENQIIVAASDAQDSATDWILLSQQLYAKWNTSVVFFTDMSEQEQPRGPYFMIDGALRQAWRCYDDPVGAFTTATTPSPSEKDTYIVPPTGKIPVPSRLGFENPSLAKPLSGLRLAVKDVIDVKGIKTGNCCRAYEMLYPARQKNAISVQRLLDLGALVVGKTKTVQFASGMHPSDWVDTHASFNCRGDGYQSPGMSSTGNAAGMAAYKWLDLAVGTDTIGSTISPSSLCALFAIRPTVGNLSVEGIIPLTKQLDTVAIMTRDAALLATVSSVLYAVPAEPARSDKRTCLLYPTDLWPKANKAFQAGIDQFVQDFEKFTHTSSERLSLSESWHDSKDTPDIPLSDYLQTSVAHIQLYDCYRNSIMFRADYKAKYGRNPYVDPPIAFKWELGKKLKEEDYVKALRELETFRSWAEESLLPNNSSRFLLFPADGDEPNYRDQYFASPQESAMSVQGFGFREHCIPALLGMPAFCVPIGEYSYTSKITGVEERLPISVNLMAPSGSDVWACNFLLEFLIASGRPTKVLTGRSAFEDGDQAV